MGVDVSFPDTHVGDLSNPYAEITQHIMGTRRYWAGVVYAYCEPIEIFDALMHGTAWVTWEGEYMRVNTVHYDPYQNIHGNPGRRPARIECSQRQRAGYAKIDGSPAYLDLIEPSPPAPDDEWLPAERARAIRELIGDRPRPKSVWVPDGHGDIMLIDPWATDREP